MNPEQITNFTSPWSQSIIGLVALGLMYVCFKLWAELKAQDAAHKVELAQKDALIYELYESRINEARVGTQLAASAEKAMVAFANAVEGKSPK